MKKLLCVLMFGMVFGGDVSQKIIEIDVELDQITTLEQLLPQYDLDWVIINIIGCYPIVEHYVSGNYYDCNLQAIESGDTQHALTIESNHHRYYRHKGNFFTDSNDGIIFSLGNVSLNPDNITFKLLVTAEFPEEDTGYIEEGFDYCIDVGANLVASPCRDEMDIMDTLPSEIADNLNGIIGQGVATTNLNGLWVGSLTGLGGGNGYWFQSNVNACFNYNCAEN